MWPSCKRAAAAALANHGCQMAIAGFVDRMCLALRASGLWLRYTTLQNLIPSFPWIAPPRPPPWRNPRKGRDQILPSGNLACIDMAMALRSSASSSPSRGCCCCTRPLPPPLPPVWPSPPISLGRSVCTTGARVRRWSACGYQIMVHRWQI